METQPKREWDEHDRDAEREAGHAPGHFNKRMRYRRGMERGVMSDSQWEYMVNNAN